MSNPSPSASMKNCDSKPPDKAKPTERSRSGQRYFRDPNFDPEKHFCLYKRYEDDRKLVTQPIFDSHCHLGRFLKNTTFADFIKKNEEEFGSTFEGCISVVCRPHLFRLDLPSNSFLKEDKVHAAFGCHPKCAIDYNNHYERCLMECLKFEKVVAFGEIGLDYVPSSEVREKQIEVFKRGLEIAMKLDLPIIIHSRETDLRVFKIMVHEVKVPRFWRIHLHSFNCSWEICELWMDAFPYLKFGLTPNFFVIEVARKLPLDKILLETDAPYFVPLKLKGIKRDSHPGQVLHVAAQVAEIKGLSVDEILRCARQNVTTIYGI